MNKLYQLVSNPVSDKNSIVQGKHYRISILTDRLVRLEYSKQGVFEDRATQKIIHRNFPVPYFTVIEKEDQIDICTRYLQIKYDKKEFTCDGLSICFTGQNFYSHVSWNYGVTSNSLKGTGRTLDGADGSIDLEDGLLSRDGYSVLDDSYSMTLDENGWVAAPIDGHNDIYFLGYGHDYRACLKDFFLLCGKTPLLPRYALGNWWSRFYAYTQQEYLSLVDRFKEEHLPFSVAVIDMDWHYVKLAEKYGSGWTGYTWNRELFPQPERLLKDLHDRGYHITLNVHPADGVRGHEAAYVPMAKELGVDYEKEIPITFDITSPQFIEAYFKYLHHPLEQEGVDFWWVDWQQGNTTKIPGLDPLWMLNHYHYLDNRKESKRAMTFSRYAGIGSHRYPVGFSGDTIITWDSLDFQPYFTATASNVGYGWWSHDIGGHMGGYRDDELMVRWVQFGVFSPIMRLHSSSSHFNSKEPWNYGEEERIVISEFLYLRHKLLPYLYTMNARFHDEGQPLIQPMYYEYAEEEEAYHVKNQYFFGNELIVNPVTAKMNPQLKVGKVTTWLPAGIWYDLFTGLIYQGNRSINMYRSLRTIPVLAKAGGIVPMAKEENDVLGTANPESLELYVFAGDEGEHVMYEDDGTSMAFEKGEAVRTRYLMEWNCRKRFVIYPAQGEISLIPATRNYRIKIFGITKCGIEHIYVEDKSLDCARSFDEKRNILTIELGDVNVEHRVEILFQEDACIAENQMQWRIFEILHRAQISYDIKEKIYKMVKDYSSMRLFCSNLHSLDICEELKDAIQEIVMA